MKYLSYIFLVATLTTTSGCAVKVVTPQEAGPRPDNYKELAANYIKSTFKDPYSLRNVKISQPIPYKILNHVGYVVCIQTNAKNSYGGYVGIEYTEIMIEQNKVWNTGNNLCNSRGGLEPWPEMESGK